jgi:hypothetical protein
VEERLVAVYCEPAIVMRSSDPRGDIQALFLQPSTQAGGSEAVSSADADDEQPLIFALTSVNLYVVRPYTAEGAVAAQVTFSQAPKMLLLRLHPLDTLAQCIVYFAFQRCCLQFTSVSGLGLFGAGPGGLAPVSVSTTEYMMLPRNRMRCQPLVTKIPQVANLHRHIASPVTLLQGAGNGNGTSAGTSGAGAGAATLATLLDSCPASGTDGGRALDRLSSGGLDLGPAQSKVKISNKDGQLLDAVHGACEGVNCARGSRGRAIDSNVCYYQLLHQVWRKLPSVRRQRSLVLTPSFVLLVEENLHQIDVAFTVHGAEPLSSVFKVRVEASPSPLFVTFIFRASGLGVFQGRKKWRLVCDSASTAARLVDECRRLGLSTSMYL